MKVWYAWPRQTVFAWQRCKMYFSHKRNGANWAAWAVFWNWFGSRKKHGSMCMDRHHWKPSLDEYWRRWTSHQTGKFVNAMKRLKDMRIRQFESNLFRCGLMAPKRVRPISSAMSWWEFNDRYIHSYRCIHCNGVLLWIEIHSWSTVRRISIFGTVRTGISGRRRWNLRRVWRAERF